jgi:hypothetical protein
MTEVFLSRTRLLQAKCGRVVADFRGHKFEVFHFPRSITYDAIVRLVDMLALHSLPTPPARGRFGPYRIYFGILSEK